MNFERSAPNRESGAAPSCRQGSRVARFYRALPRSAKVSLVLSTVFFLWLEAQCARGLWLMMGAHVQVRYPWLYMLAILFPWGFCVHALWLVSRMVEDQRIEGRDPGVLMILLAALPFWSYFLLGLGVEFVSTVARTRFTLPFF